MILKVKPIALAIGAVKITAVAVLVSTTSIGSKLENVHLAFFEDLTYASDVGLPPTFPGAPSPVEPIDFCKLLGGSFCVPPPIPECVRGSIIWPQCCYNSIVAPLNDKINTTLQGDGEFWPLPWGLPNC